MRLGLILECTPDGPDVHVCTRIIKLLNENHGTNIELAKPATLINKPGLILRCGEVASQLIHTEKCDRVVIVWDIDPPRKWGREHCLAKDRTDILAALTAANVDHSKVLLSGISRELDSWLTADGRAIRQCISDIRRRQDLPPVDGARRPEDHAQPKNWLNSKFKENGLSGYNDFIHAKKIIACLPDFRELKRSETFVRFVLKASDVKL